MTGDLNKTKWPSYSTDMAMEQTRSHVFRDVAPDVSKEPSTFAVFQQLKEETPYSFELSGEINPATRRHLPEDVRR